MYHQVVNGSWQDWEDTFVISGCNETKSIESPYEVYLNPSELIVDGSNDWKYRAYLRFDLSDLKVAPERYNIAKVELCFYLTAGNEFWTSSVYDVTTPNAYYSPEGLTWNNQPGFTVGSMSKQYSMSGKSLNTWQKVDVTDIVRSWLNGTPDYGILMKANEEGQYRHNWTFSTGANDVSLKPYLKISGKKYITT